MTDPVPDPVPEPILEPERRIVDPHHHLWPGVGREPYQLADLHEDTGSGHKVEATVFIECLAAYREDGPEHLKCVGETAFVAREAAASRDSGGAVIAAIVARANLSDTDTLDEVLDAHVEAGDGLFRGIRHAGAWDAAATRKSHHQPTPHLYLEPAFQEGLKRLAARGFSFDAWLYHPQIPELTALARAVPDARIVMDHFGGPLGFAPYTDRRAVFAQWRRDAAELATCPNMFVKLGGMAMPINGYGWENGPAPSSQEFVAAQGDVYRAAIDLFGPDRCMFESNFPVDKVSLPYATLWNAFKRIAASYSEAEKDRLFRGTAAHVYRLDAQR